MEPVNQAPTARNVKAWGTAPGIQSSRYSALKARNALAHLLRPVFGVRRQSEARRRFGLRGRAIQSGVALRSATALQNLVHNVQYNFA